MVKEITVGDEEWEPVPEGEKPGANVTALSLLDSAWYDEIMDLWVKYGLSPAYVREMRMIKTRLGGSISVLLWMFWRVCR